MSEPTANAPKPTDASSGPSVALCVSQRKPASPRTGKRGLALIVAVALVFGAGFLVARATGGSSPIGAGALEPADPSADDTYLLTVLVTGSASVLPYASDLCYSEKALEVSFEVRDPSGAILALADSAEPLGCDELLVTFTVPPAAAYEVELETGGVWGFGGIGGSWGPFSFVHLDRSGWVVNLSDAN